MSMASKPKQAVAAPPDSAARQIGTRAVFWLIAAPGLAICAAGGFAIDAGFVGGKVLPLYVGLGIVLLLTGLALTVAGVFCARHARLIEGKLDLGGALDQLLARPAAGRVLKWSGHGAGMLTLLACWLQFLFPAGVPLP